MNKVWVTYLKTIDSKIPSIIPFSGLHFYYRPNVIKTLTKKYTKSSK